VQHHKVIKIHDDVILAHLPVTGVQDVLGKTVAIVIRASVLALRSAMTAAAVTAAAAAAAAAAATAQGSRRAVVRRDNGRVAHRLRCGGGD